MTPVHSGWALRLVALGVLLTITFLVSTALLVYMAAAVQSQIHPQAPARKASLLYFKRQPETIGL